jgi:hypothetical protein
VIKTFLRFGTVLGTVGLAFALMGSDHRDGPSTTADPAIDITDLYAWHNAANNTLDIDLNFSGFRTPGQPATYDDNTIYSIHINRSATTTFNNNTDAEIDVRFGKNLAGTWGVQVLGVPGASSPTALTGPVETIITDGPRKLYSGLRDDPFFFDLDGFHAALMNGNVLSMHSTHDSFAGTNVTAIVLEMALSDVTVNGTMPHLSIWATSGRQPSAVGMNDDKGMNKGMHKPAADIRVASN